MNEESQQRLDRRVREAHIARFGEEPTIVAYAPGRVEVLGNHTDYNEGFVLSTAIDAGVCFALSPARDGTAQLLAADLEEATSFPSGRPAASSAAPWSNYTKGVLHHLAPGHGARAGFRASFGGDIPMGAGLSSSAALEVATGLALARYYGRSVAPLELARIGQRAEAEFAGVRCGLLDQITSLFGEPHALVYTDFRTLSVSRVELPAAVAFLMCNTGVKHQLVDSEYNERRERCEEAAAYFAARLDHPVSHLRDVSPAEWERLADGMDPVTARRAAHVIGENERVQQGIVLLAAGDLSGFGGLMFASHESSRHNFENSCPELDFIVAQAETTPGVYGARLSGGGFGGSAVALVDREAAGAVAERLGAAYRERFDHEARVRLVTPSAGARLLRG